MLGRVANWLPGDITTNHYYNLHCFVVQNLGDYKLYNPQPLVVPSLCSGATAQSLQVITKFRMSISPVIQLAM